jgi:hypothetical protein
MESIFIKRVLNQLSLCLLLLCCAGQAVATEVVTADFQTVLTNHSGEFDIWNLADNKSVYVFDFPSLTRQGHTFNRAMQLIEQFKEPYKRVLSIEEINKYLDSIRRNQANFAYGHDFMVSELVLFFNLAARDKLELLPEEIVLRDFLVNQGLMDSWRGFYRALKPGVVILSIPQEQERHDNEPKINELARRAIFTHERSHAEYYTNPYYADYCRKFWNDKLSNDQKKVFTKFFSNYNYSVNQLELMVNEMQAYLMFTPDPNSISAAKLGIKEEEWQAMKTLFRQDQPPTRLPM